MSEIEKRRIHTWASTDSCNWITTELGYNNKTLHPI